MSVLVDFDEWLFPVESSVRAGGRPIRKESAFMNNHPGVAQAFRTLGVMFQQS